MAQGDPRPGEFYLHFKQKLYQVLTVAEHTETGEELVVYQAMYGDFRTYARPRSMFIGGVDSEKYPEASQTYRFRLVQDIKNEVQAGDRQDKGNAAVTEPAAVSSVPPVLPAERLVPSLLIDFYDADTFEAKYKILLQMKDIINDTMINNMAVVLDLVIAEGDTEVRYEELKRCLRTCQKYETSRLH